MGRPRLSAKELKLRGCAPGTPNYSRYKDRLAEPDAKAAPVLPFRPLSKVPPGHLTPKQKQLWKRLLTQVPRGVLSRSHAVVVEIAVVLWEKVSAGTAKPSELSQLRAILLSFEMTPTRVQSPSTPLAAPTETERERANREADAALAEFGNL